MNPESVEKCIEESVEEYKEIQDSVKNYISYMKLINKNINDNENIVTKTLLEINNALPKYRQAIKDTLNNYTIEDLKLQYTPIVFDIKEIKANIIQS